MSEEKTCKGCGETKPVDEFQVVRKRKDGSLLRRTKCNKCMSAYHKSYLDANPDKKKKVYESHNKWQKENKEKVNEYHKEYAKANREKVSENHKRWRDKSQYAKKRWAEKKAKEGKQDKRKGPKAIPDSDDGTRLCGVCGETKDISLFPANKITKRGGIWRDFTCKSCHNQAHMAYEKRRLATDEGFRQQRKVLGNNTLAKRRGASGKLRAKEWTEVKAKYGNKCLRCGKQEPEIKLTVDHVLPLAKGGTNDKDNVQPLCKSCNSRKHTNHIDYRT
jgi:hypothetical protein